MDDNSPKPPPGPRLLVAVGVVEDGPCPECGEDRTSAGPSRVNSNRYRDNWDRIFAKSDPRLN